MEQLSFSILSPTAPTEGLLICLLRMAVDTRHNPLAYKLTHVGLLLVVSNSQGIHFLWRQLFLEVSGDYLRLSASSELPTNEIGKFDLIEEFS